MTLDERRRMETAAIIAVWQGHCLDVRELPDGSVAALVRLLYTTAILLGLDRCGYSDRYCFADESLARLTFSALQSEDEKITGHVASRVTTEPRQTDP